MVRCLPAASFSQAIDIDGAGDGVTLALTGSDTTYSADSLPGRPFVGDVVYGRHAVTVPYVSGAFVGTGPYHVDEYNVAFQLALQNSNRLGSMYYVLVIITRTLAQQSVCRAVLPRQLVHPRLRPCPWLTPCLPPP